MARIRRSAEQIIGKLREAEVLLGQGHKVPEVRRRLGVTEQTYYRWRKEYGRLKTDHAKRRPRLRCILGTLSPSRFQIRSTRL